MRPIENKMIRGVEWFESEYCRICTYKQCGGELKDIEICIQAENLKLKREKHGLKN
jgi:hypothetical protein